MAREFLVSVDPEDGRVELLGRDGWSAIRVDGVWEAGRLFQVADLKDNFFSVRDEAEVNALVKEAKEAFGVK